MSEEPDINKMAAEFVTQNMERFYSTGKDVIKGAADSVRLHLNRSYKDYLECVINRHSKSKSFFIRNEATYLYNFYVPTSISTRQVKIDQPSIETISKVNPFTIITGSGGSGKSMLMRHLLLDAVIQKDKIPIFLELRDLNQTEQPLLDFIRETLHSNHFKLDDEYIERALKAGHFALLFDGFDEVTFTLRKSIRKQLLDLAKKYDNNVIILSSRPDNEFSGWPIFSVYRMDALTLEQAVILVRKLPFDTDIKRKFAADLKGGLFEKHESFLSNPLLLSIMLLTYGEYADIPDKLSIFYSQAYETLFQRHDALKAGFQRDRLTKLDLTDFARVFSAFSVQTFDKRQFQVTQTQALEYFDKAKNIVGISFSSYDYLKDAEQAVCLLVEEGLMIAFSHRSFQEYFVAKFICDSNPEIQEKLLQRYSINLMNDNVFELVYEMRPELAERVIIIPAINEVQRLIGFKRKVGISHYLRFMKLQGYNIEIQLDDIWFTRNAKRDYSDLFRSVLKKYGKLVGWSIDSAKLTVETEAICKNFPNADFGISKLTTKHELIRSLAFGSGFFSIRMLEAVFKIKEVLIEKHHAAEQTLDELLR